MVDVADFYDNRMAQKAEAERTAKAATSKAFAKGAKTLEEHRILVALRKEPATSMGDLQNRSGLNSAAAMLAVSALTSRNLVREVNSTLGTTTIVAVA